MTSSNGSYEALCERPEDCQGHYRRCTHGSGGPFSLACHDCLTRRHREGRDYCATESDDGAVTVGLPFPLDAYRSTDSEGAQA